MTLGQAFAGALASMALTGAAQAAEPFEWTGIYEGFVVCDDVTAGAGGTFGLPMTVAIMQTGDRIDARNSVQVEPSRGASHTLYRGRVMSDVAGDTMSGYLEVCGATFPHKELVRIFPTATARQPFGFAADTVFVSGAVPGEAGMLVVESCKWSLRRTSPEPPTFEPCP